MNSSLQSPTGLPDDPQAREELIRSHLKRARERVESARNERLSDARASQSSPESSSASDSGRRPVKSPDASRRTPSPLQSQFHRPAFYTDVPQPPPVLEEEGESDSSSHSPDLSYYQRAGHSRSPRQMPQYPPHWQASQPRQPVAGRARVPNSPRFQSSQIPTYQSRSSSIQQQGLRAPPAQYGLMPRVPLPLQNGRPATDQTVASRRRASQQSSTDPNRTSRQTQSPTVTVTANQPGSKTSQPDARAAPRTPEPVDPRAGGNSGYTTPVEYPTILVSDPNPSNHPAPAADAAPRVAVGDRKMSARYGSFTSTSSTDMSDSDSDALKDGELLNEKKDASNPSADTTPLVQAALGASHVGTKKSSKSTFGTTSALRGPGSSTESISVPSPGTFLHNNSSGSSQHDDRFQTGIAKTGLMLSIPPQGPNQVTSDGQSGSLTPTRFSPKSATATTRESTTSLPGVIRRALRLASSMEQSRSYSRWDNDWETPHQPNPDFGTTAKRRSGGSINTLLNAFPQTPQGGTPPPHHGDRVVSVGSPSHLRHMEAANAPADELDEKQEARRRCCGLPLWLFIVINTLLICLIAAVIVVPIALLVIPRQRGPHSAAPPMSESQCIASMSCLNGGNNFVDAAGTCSCSCPTGFTGATCSQASSAVGCTTLVLPNKANASIGSALPSLINNADPTYGIPLDASSLLSLFSSNSLSCSTQNALVSFNGASTSSRFAARATFDPKGSDVLNFARVATLYIFQVEHNLEAATNAQNGLQTYLVRPSEGDPSNVALTDSWSADLENFTLYDSSTHKTVGGKSS